MEDAFKGRFSGKSNGVNKQAGEHGNDDGVFKAGGRSGTNEAAPLCEAYKARGLCLNGTCKRSHTRPEDDQSTGKSMIFQLARGDGVTYPEADRLSAVEDEIKILKSQWNAKQTTKLELCKRQLDAHDDRFRMLISKFDDIKAIQDRLSGQNSHLQQLAKTVEACEKNTVEACGKKITTADGEIDNELFNAMMIGLHQHEKDLDTIFAERDALLEQIGTSNARVTKLEDLVRNLTLQYAASTSPASGNSPTMVQQLPMQTVNGQTINLSVPKGASLGSNNTKENRAPSGIRSFTTGEQWTA
ncbi:hypothetical protein LTR86_008998 [Recurvomyces mirabilis]|nr:hypothetical protein LTR86_008998 [Recurvomyces mirabilis]